jgi:2-iminoacetate synthase
MSAGSKTNPGGYSGNEDSLEQFSISDERSPAEIAKMLKSKGYEPVWKDWDSSYHCRSQSRPFNSLSNEIEISDQGVVCSVQ